MKNVRKLYLAWTFVLCLTPSAVLMGQSGTQADHRSVGQELDAWVTSMEQQLVPAADAMPEDRYAFVPTNGEFKGVRTFAEQITHPAATNYILASAVLGERPPHGEHDESAPDSIRTKTEIMDYLKGSFAYLHRAAAAIDEKNETATIAAMRNRTRPGLVVDALVHSSDHYGQVVEYLRMNGIVPPASRSGTAAQQNVRATIQSPENRKPAPAFRLIDASGKAVGLSDYRGKVVLLDFWATECGGCKVEIPWFMEFEQAYKDKGLVVIGVSMDILYEDLKNADEGWSRVKPFVQAHKVNYTILMGDDPVAKAYSINALPATYLIDGNGRIAATYVGLVDKGDVEANVKTLLKQH